MIPPLSSSQAPLNPQLFEGRDIVAVRGVELRPSDDVQTHREKLARILLDEMFQFVGLLDARGTLIDVNRNALEGAGIALDRTLGLPFWEARWWQVSRETQEGVKEGIRRASQGEFVRHDVEIYGSGAGEDTIIIDYSLIPIFDRTGEVVMLLAEGRNITEKKRAEAEIARKNHELQRLLDRLRELDEVKTQFFANVSHELRTPLALVLGPVERILAEGANLTPGQRRDLEVVRGNAAVLLKQVNDLLDISKLDAGRMTLDYVASDLVSLVRQTASNFDALAPQRDIAFAVDAPPSLPAEVDAAKLERVVLNLLSNAFKFTPPGGRITLTLRDEPGDRAILSVQDSGPGVPAHQRDAIFERFRQADGTATREQGGTGLGLSIARDFAELHGGTIGVTDAPGGGALFQLGLPIRAPEGTPVRRARNAAEVRAQALGGGSGLDGVLEELRRAGAEEGAEADAPASWVLDDRPRVLVVEDNADLRRFIRDTLAGRFRVATAQDGQEGLEKARDLLPDLVVSDIMMPRMSGDVMAATFREDPALRDIPVLILSAKADDALRLRLLRGTVQDYLVKPFSAEELVARAANLAALKRTRDVLLGEVEGQKHDIEALAREVADRHHELRDAVDAARVALARAEAASQAKGDFIRLVSHELRSPLTSVVLHLDLLRRAGGDGWTPRQADLLDRMEASSRRLVEVVGAVLEQARIGSRDFSLEAEEVDLAALGREVVAELREPAVAKGLPVTVDARPGPRLRTDPRLLRLLLRHLLDNAVKFTDRGEVRLRLDAAQGRLSVTDTGPGIAPEDRARIFEPFREGTDVAHKHAQGLGLGLAVVRQVVEVLGGQLDLDSGPGRGSTFTVTLPPLSPAEAA
jgi:PAS domain S-box-containing protein